MSSERETCGLGSFIPMSCRGRAEAFARRLQSRLQTLGRSSSGLDESADESSWIGRQSSVTSCQPRLSSSSDSDIFFDFDLDAPGSPEEDTVPPPSQPAKNQVPHDVDSGSVLSLATTERTSPVSEESSDERYFDPEFSDCESSRSEALNDSRHKHETPSGGDANKALCNGHIPNSKTENSNLRTSDDNCLNSTSVTERHNKINLSKLENLNTEAINYDLNHCTQDNCEDCTTRGTTLPNHAHVVLVPDSGGKEPDNIVREEVHKTDDLSNNTETSECATSAKSETVFTSAGCSVNCNTETLNCEDVRILSDASVCSSNSKCSEDSSCSMPDDTCENSSYISAVSNEDTDVSDNDHELESCSHSCSTFNRPKNLLIDCAVLSSGLEQLSVLVPLRIDSVDNTTSEASADTESDYKLEVDSQTHTDDETCDFTDDEDRPRRITRSSSLKSGKTPPGTPGRKKIVRFADVLGLDLADVRTFLDDIPWVPQSAYQDLQDVDLSDTTSPTTTQGSVSNGIAYARRADKCLVPMFQQPVNQLDFLDKVRERQVCLESAVVTDTIFFTISGVVRVRNLDFHKSVYVRYTLNGWKTFSDLQATYVDGSCDGFSDKFSFKIYAHTVSIGSKVEFAIRFQSKGVQYWDSNLGANYTFQCLPPIAPTATSLPLASPVDTWTASFY